MATLADGSEKAVATVADNFRRNCTHAVELNGVTGLRLECCSTNGIERAQVYAVRVFGN